MKTPPTNVTLGSKMCLSPAGRVIVVRTKRIQMSHLGKHILLQVEQSQTLTKRFLLNILTSTLFCFVFST